MATDGVKIIDGDWAHDVYMGFMDMYDAGLSISKIKAQTEELGRACTEGFDHEVFITAYALALWEVGELTEEIHQKVAATVAREACALFWREQVGEKAYGARVRETNRLLAKLSSPAVKVRKRKKHRMVTNFHYSEGDVLAFRGRDNHCYATYLLFITQHRGECVYHFAQTSYRGSGMPTMDDIYASSIVGRKIGCSPSVSPEGFVVGLGAVGLLHPQLYDYKPNLHRIGNLKVKDGFRRLGIQGGARDWADFTRIHEGLEGEMKAFGMGLYPVREVMKMDPLLNES